MIQIFFKNSSLLSVVNFKNTKKVNCYHYLYCYQFPSQFELSSIDTYPFINGWMQVELIDIYGVHVFTHAFSTNHFYWFSLQITKNKPVQIRNQIIFLRQKIKF